MALTKAEAAVDTSEKTLACRSPSSICKASLVVLARVSSYHVCVYWQHSLSVDHEAFAPPYYQTDRLMSAQVMRPETD